MKGHRVCAGILDLNRRTARQRADMGNQCVNGRMRSRNSAIDPFVRDKQRTLYVVGIAQRLQGGLNSRAIFEAGKLVKRGNTNL